MGLALFTLVGLDAQLEEQEPIGALAGCFTNNTADKLLAPKPNLQQRIRRRRRQRDDYAVRCGRRDALMLQPVVPYALTGLALGSLMKRPGAGALIGSLVGVAQTTSTGSMGRLGYGLGPGSPEGISKGRYRQSAREK